ncbi:C4-dicarboxylate TRAP transporter substrate-binding protein [Nitratireductor sp. ZSWI3]|uniref:C4-dicarboxylate TRAP transporter substrate-binding protein n=1 Tax=Nitratireductor sp. ZSWI3 TaxID=2966359 RepID=UPI0021504826|nr:C4-dicarboxylate TRAP transporter substrate-binding protein [Nitratireductor sp. ZSWI3]MCR4268728.1 C4-dicarboxylate TRAP transporter substrate-binding protein [Nitratireductor sp. ZSWI3]
MKKLLALAALSAGLWASAASADVYQATNWMTPVHILNEETYQKFSQDVKANTQGAVTFEVYSGGSLVPAKATMQAIRDGVAALGIVYPGYTPSELPLNNVLNDLVFVSDDDIASAFAYTEMGMTNEKIIGEWKKNGGIFAGGYSTPVYNFICVKPIRQLADASGRKIRTAGGAQTAWVEAIGGVPVSVPIGDVYSGLSRGSIDCTMSDPTNLDKGNKFWEVAKSVTLLPMGVVIGANYVINPSFWQGLKPEERRVILDDMAKGNARAQVAYHVGVNAALEGSKERGLEIAEPSDDLKSKLAEFQSGFVDGLAEKSMADRGVEDPSDIIAEFQKLQEKWKGLLEGVDRTDAEALAKVLQDNLYSKIDENSFGMN